MGRGYGGVSWVMGLAMWMWVVARWVVPRSCVVSWVVAR